VTGTFTSISDSGVLEQLVRDAGRSGEHADLAARVRRRFVALVRDYLERNPLLVREIAGAKRLVDRLLGLPGVRVAAQRAMQGVTFSRATYFGDGPWDRRASAELGYDFIAVGGKVPHHVAYADLAETDGIVARLTGAVREGSA
jgi:hypothetical protein